MMSNLPRVVVAGGSGSLRMNLALSGPPKFRHAPPGEDHLKAGIVIAPSLDYMDRAWRDARVTKIWAGSNEIMKELIGRKL